MLNRPNEVVLGGTSQAGDWDDTIRASDRQRIWDGCCRMVPSLKVHIFVPPSLPLHNIFTF